MTLSYDSLTPEKIKEGGREEGRDRKKKKIEKNIDTYNCTCTVYILPHDMLYMFTVCTFIHTCTITDEARCKHKEGQISNNLNGSVGNCGTLWSEIQKTIGKNNYSIVSGDNSAHC